MKQIKCHKCNIIKDSEKFSLKNNSKRGFSYVCKECHNKYSRERWYKINKNKQVKSSLKWRHNNRIKYLSTQYNIPQNEIIEAINKADGKCIICNENKKLVLDHCHVTKKIRGFICNNCNVLLGMAKDNITILENAIKYIAGGR